MFPDHMLKEVIKFMKHDKLIAEDEPLPEHLDQNVEVADNVENEVCSKKSFHRKKSNIFVSVCFLELG